MNLSKKLPIICLIVMSLLLQSCIKNFQELGEKLENELILEIATDLLFNIAAIQFIDENTQLAPANITVEWDNIPVVVTPTITDNCDTDIHK